MTMLNSDYLHAARGLLKASTAAGAAVIALEKLTTQFDTLEEFDTFALTARVLRYRLDYLRTEVKTMLAQAWPTAAIEETRKLFGEVWELADHELLACRNLEAEVRADIAEKASR